MNILLAPYVTLRFLLTRSNRVIACWAVLWKNDKGKKSARVIRGLTSQESGQAMLAGAGDGGAVRGQEAPAGCGRTVPTHSTVCGAQLTRVWSLELGEIFSFSVFSLELIDSQTKCPQGVSLLKCSAILLRDSGRLNFSPLTPES